MDQDQKRSGLSWTVPESIASVTQKMSYVAAMFISLMALINVGDVVGRFLFNHPIKGSYELIALLLACGGTWGMGYCEARKKHITIDIVVDRLPRRWQAVIDVFTYAISLGTFSLIVWQMLLRVPRGNLSEDLGLPMAIFYAFFAFGVGGYCLMLLGRLLQSLTAIRRR